MSDVLLVVSPAFFLSLCIFLSPLPGSPASLRLSYLLLSNTTALVWAMASSAGAVPCLDFAEFKRVITERRVVDDHISHALNTTVPTKSNVDHVDATENCRRLFSQACAREDGEQVEAQCKGEDGGNERTEQGKESDTSPDRTLPSFAWAVFASCIFLSPFLRCPRFLILSACFFPSLLFPVCFVILVSGFLVGRARECNGDDSSRRRVWVEGHTDGTVRGKSSMFPLCGMDARIAAARVCMGCGVALFLTLLALLLLSPSRSTKSTQAVPRPLSSAWRRLTPT